MEPHSVELCKSLFFQARTVTLPFASSSSGYSRRIHDEMNPESESSSSSSASSSSGYSTRIRDLMKLKTEAGMSKEDADIEASKSHWTDTVYYTAPMSACMESSEELLQAQKLYKENVEVMKSLQSENAESSFFEIGGKVLGRKIGEGGQAEIYEGYRKYVGYDGEEREMSIIFKVFKGVYSLHDLRKQWPRASLREYNSNGDKTDPVINFNLVTCGRLLDDGRFAFEMWRYWGDLRKFLDHFMQHNGNRHAPLMKLEGTYYDHCMFSMMHGIAKGMRDLHREDTLHRDLKASNVHIDGTEYGDITKFDEDRLDPSIMEHRVWCSITDYECSIGVVGTGYWRAPEILKAVKNQTIYTIPNLFTPKSDVYSYAMTCYEILTGLVPFEDHVDYGTSIDDVLQGKRPTLPKHLWPWVEESFNRCWHVDPFKRPTFDEIVHVLNAWPRWGTY